MEATVPPEWRKCNSWGPEANAARANGTLQPYSCPPELARWEVFGRSMIQDGDLLFRFSISYTVRGRIGSELIARASDSPFSHHAIAHWENDTLYVFDTVPAPGGVRKIPFAFWALDITPHTFAIMRLKPEFRGHIPAAIGYIEEAYWQQVPFDSALKLDDNRLYCSEMIEKAFRSSGLMLSEELLPRCLPHYLRFAWLGPPAKLFRGIDIDEPLFALGNRYYGIFGSPKLELVYSDFDDEQREANREPPRCATPCFNRHTDPRQDP